MTEFDDAPTAGGLAGLPGPLPPGERVLWQGKPCWRVLARTAFHARLVAAYFALLAGWAAADALAGGSGGFAGVARTLAAGVLAVALLHLLAWVSARATVYTLTDRRIVLRIGVAVPKCINLPLARIAAADLAQRADGTGDLPLRLDGAPKLGFGALWPHARAWRVVAPQPMLRAVPDAAAVAALVARACAAAGGGSHLAVVERAPPPARPEAVAA